MKITIHVSGQCECGGYMLTSFDGLMRCENTDCPAFGKKFKLPVIELEEAKQDESAGN